MTVSYGRAPAGVRVADSKPANWGKNLTVVGAIKNDRIVCHRTFEGAMNKPRFIDFIGHVLSPRLSPGAVVVLDNLRAHHAPEVREAVEAAGAHVLYLPPYSPDLNPIELCWSFAKACPRRLAHRTEISIEAGTCCGRRMARTDLRALFEEIPDPRVQRTRDEHADARPRGDRGKAGEQEAEGDERLLAVHLSAQRAHGGGGGASSQEDARPVGARAWDKPHRSK